MENKNVVMATLCFCVAISMGYTLYQQQVVIDRQEQDMAFIKEHLEDIYGNSARENARTYTIMDTIIRIFHYAKPHKGPTWNCPECSEIHDKSKGEGKTKTKEAVIIREEPTVKVDAGTAALAVALQNVHKHSVMRDTAIIQNVLRTQHHLKMHKQKHKMCPDCLSNNSQENLVSK
jgi:hypothetical protein|tara:strand:+ start:5215 stop:5742 length:528 start_codon:yes stop_codon:yes gene_type:complete